MRLWVSAWPLLLAAACAPGCTLALGYPELPLEMGELECHDGRDNDRDGRIDCEDDSCVRCVASPSVGCPEGWTPPDPNGPPGVCAPPADAVFAGCATQPDAGADVVAATDGALAAYVAGHPPIPGNSAPLVVWLAPGVHVESFVIHDHVVIHGLCDGATRATLRSPAGQPMPVTVDTGHVELDHVALEPGPGVDAPAGRGGAIDVFHASIGSNGDELAGLAVSSGMTMLLDHVSVTVPIYFTAARLTLRDASTRSLTGNSGRLEIASSYVEGDISIGGAVATLVASDLFVRCGELEVREGSTVALRDAAFVHALRAPAIEIAGTDGGELASATLENVSTTSSAACPAPPTLGLGAVVDLRRTDLHASRLVVTTDVQRGFRASLASVVSLVDATLDGGLEIVDSAIEADRVRVRRSKDFGVRVSGTSIATLRRTYVEDIPLPARDPDTCSTATAGIWLESGTATVSSSAVDRVSGCGIVVAPGVTVVSIEGAVDGAWAGLCAQGRSDGASLGASLSLAHVGTPSSAFCPDVTCLPAACRPANEIGLCVNLVDDDGDGLADCLDRDCASDLACLAIPESGHCADGADNDLDGQTDCTDSDCAMDRACGGEVGRCTDSIDNDTDGDVDCVDPDCGCDAACAAPAEACPGMDLGSATGVVVFSTTLPSAAAWCLASPPGCASARGSSAAYVWTAPSAGTYTFSTGPGSGMGFDTVLQVLSSCSGPELACNDDDGVGFQSSATAVLAGGQSVIVRVRAYAATTAETYSLTITPR